MATKSCGIDVLPTTLLKDNLDHLVGVLTKLVNTSLKQESIQNLGKGHCKTLVKENRIRTHIQYIQISEQFAFYFETSRTLHAV